MDSQEVSCKVDNQVLKIQSSLLVKQIPFSLENPLIFPSYLHAEDLHLYINFQATGYLNLNNLYRTIRIILVADFLHQKSTCGLLISLIAPHLTSDNFQSLESLKNLSNETKETFASQSSLLTNPTPLKPVNTAKAPQTKSVNRCSLPALQDKQESQTPESFISKLSDQLSNLKNSDLEADFEFNWKISLKDSLFCRSEHFSFKNQDFFLTVERESDQLEFFLNSESSDEVMLIRGLLISQGISSNFFYLTGAKQLIDRTSQKTSCVTVKIASKEEHDLLVILKQASEEALKGACFLNHSSLVVSLIASYLAHCGSGDRATEIVDCWLESNPNSTLDQTIRLLSWKSKDSNYPVGVKNDLVLTPTSQVFTQTNPYTHDPEVSYLDISPQITPKNPLFCVDFSNISTPKSKPRCPRNRINLFSRSCVSTLRSSRSPSDLKSLMLIKELKRKLVNQSSYMRGKINVSIFN